MSNGSTKITLKSGDFIVIRRFYRKRFAVMMARKIGAKWTAYNGEYLVVKPISLF